MRPDPSAASARFQRNIALTVLLAESTHVFCCVIPTVVTALSVLAGMGLLSNVPGFLLDFHEVMHAWEVPIIVASGAVLAAGWGLSWLAAHTECQKDHCEPHETVCGPRKSSSRIVLIVATLLFAVNLSIYLTVHVGLERVYHISEHAHAHGHAPGETGVH